MTNILWKIAILIFKVQVKPVFPRGNRGILHRYGRLEWQANKSTGAVQ
jgi:hypothetical protein